jgi:hypothetical protein
MAAIFAAVFKEDVSKNEKPAKAGFFVGCGNAWFSMREFVPFCLLLFILSGAAGFLLLDRRTFHRAV